MGDLCNYEQIEEVCNQLKHSQDFLEKHAFQAINHHDKMNVNTAISMSQVVDLLSTLEMVGMELETIAMEIGGRCKEPVQKLQEVLSKQGDFVEKIGMTFQQMRNEQEELSESLHQMEEAIANQRDSIQMVEELLLCDIKL